MELPTTYQGSGPGATISWHAVSKPMPLFAPVISVVVVSASFVRLAAVGQAERRSAAGVDRVNFAGSDLAGGDYAFGRIQTARNGIPSRSAAAA
jgi:hypothetical protein